MKRVLVATLCCLVGGTFAAFANAAPQESTTLRKIRESGVIVVGYRDGSVPFSYLDELQHPIGYSMDMCNRIVDVAKARLQLPNLSVKLVPVTSATRIPMVANGMVDIECGVTTNTIGRQQRVAFSVTIFVATSRLVSKRSSGIGALADLKGRIVVSTLGTTTIKRLPELNAERGLRMTILGVRDDAEAFRMVETDRAVAYAMDDVLLHSAVAGSSRPDDYVISDEALSVEPYAAMLGKGDPEFKAMVDDAIKQLFASGELRRLYAKWFESPIPPKGINLHLKMPAAMGRVIERPTDSGDPADYH